MGISIIWYVLILIIYWFDKDVTTMFKPTAMYAIILMLYSSSHNSMPVFELYMICTLLGVSLYIVYFHSTSSKYDIFNF